LGENSAGVGSFRCANGTALIINTGCFRLIGQQQQQPGCQKSQEESLELNDEPNKLMLLFGLFLFILFNVYLLLFHRLKLQLMN